MRNTDINISDIHNILNKLMDQFTDDWLLTLEICELVKDKNTEIYKIAYNHFHCDTGIH